MQKSQEKKPKVQGEKLENSGYINSKK